MSKADDVLKQLSEIDRLKNEAIQELLGIIEDANKKLEQLGYNGTSKKRAKRQIDPNKTCPVCGEKGHDARKHRGEKKTKKAAK